VFLGTHGQHNIGDELLLETFLSQLGAEHHYVVNSYDPSFTAAQLAERYDVGVIDTAGDRPRLVRELLRSDVVVFGGGSIIKELYRSTGRNRYATLLMILAIVSFARWIGRKPIGMFNVGVGPITTPLGRMLARAILSQVDEVSVRDAASHATCVAAGIPAAHVRIATDAVFAVPPHTLVGSKVDTAAARRTPPAPQDAPLRVALNLNYDIENADGWEPFLERLAEALRRIDRRRKIELHTVPMQSRFKEHNDAVVLRRFAARLPDVAIVHHHPTDHHELSRVLTHCDLLLTERLHALIVASILGVPTFVLAYDVKVREAASALGLCDMTVDINRPFGVEAITEPITKLIEDLEGAGHRLRTSSAGLAELARGEFDTARAWVRGRAAS
jgi:polysaccharide pyruvyl transferase CsaB